MYAWSLLGDSPMSLQMPFACTSQQVRPPPGAETMRAFALLPLPYDVISCITNSLNFLLLLQHSWLIRCRYTTNVSFCFNSELFQKPRVTFYSLLLGQLKRREGHMSVIKVGKGHMLCRALELPCRLWRQTLSMAV